jgi:hypothetical protein
MQQKSDNKRNGKMPNKSKLGYYLSVFGRKVGGDQKSLDKEGCISYIVFEICKDP